LFPILSLAQWDAHDYVAYIDRDVTITGNWDFTGEVTMLSLEVDTVVVEYIDAEYVDADSILLQAGGKFKLGDGDSYLKEIGDDSLSIFVHSEEITRFYYNLQFLKVPLLFDSTGKNRTIDLSVEDDGSGSKYWIYCSSQDFARRDGFWRHNYLQLDSYLLLYTNSYISFNGTSLASPSARFRWSTGDADANCLSLTMSEGGSVGVPVLIIQDSTGWGKNWGWFNGVTEPRTAWIDDDNDSWVGMGHASDDLPALMYGGQAKALKLPDILRFGLHTKVAGDTVAMNMFIDAADSVLKIVGFDNQLLTIADLNP
jgi:hypothetical protein